MPVVADRMEFKNLVAPVALLFILSLGFGNMQAFGQPMTKDANLRIESTVQGLSFPTSMMFLDVDHIFSKRLHIGSYLGFEGVGNGKYQDDTENADGDAKQ